MGSGAFQLVEVEEKFLSELARLAPGFPSNIFLYSVSRFLSDEAESSPKSVRDELDEIAEKAIGLSAAIGALSIEALELLDEQEIRFGGAGLTKSVSETTSQLMGVAEMARRDAERQVAKGRPPAPNTLLVSDLSIGVRMMGKEPNAKAQGPLVIAFQIALEIAGKQVAAPDKTVASALASLGKQSA